MGFATERWPPAPLALRLAPHLLVASLLLGLVASLVFRPSLGMGLPVIAGLGIAGLAALRGSRPATAIALVAGCLIGSGWVWGGARLDATQPPALELPQRVSGTVSVAGPATQAGDGRVRLRLRAEHLMGAGDRWLPEGLRMLAWIDDARPPQGALLRVDGELRRPASGAAPDWWRSYLRRQRIGARLEVDDIEVVGRRGGLEGLRYRWRAWTARHAAIGLDGDRRAMVRGMALGGGAELSESSARAMRDAGVWHLLAVSGQNVTVVAIAVLGLLRAAGVSRRSGVLAAILALVAYCLACDGGASVGRAGVVGALGLLGELNSLARLRWHLLLVALVSLLAFDPRSLGDPGLQLSFAAVVGLFVAAPPVAGFLEGWMPPRVAQLAGLAAGAGLATAPVVVWHFERVSIAGLAVNVVAVPLAAPVVVVALVGIPAAAVHPAAGEVCAQLAGLGAEAILQMARVSARVPAAAVDLPRAVAPALIALPALPHLARRVLPAMRPVQRRLVGGAAVVVLAGLIALGGARPEPWPVSPELRILDVGQGNAALLRSPAGEAALIDTGPPGSPAPLEGRLRQLGVGRIDLLVLSHGSLDHVGGLEALLARAAPRLVALGPEIPPDQRARLDRRLG
ncbi:MAG: ComEC/Rec2 family competence protein, partial [Thermoleophilia bacterium]|nr:ComEC/Rec2 family competence protein [Thermoleophilia bacterium]